MLLRHCSLIVGAFLCFTVPCAAADADAKPATDPAPPAADQARAGDFFAGGKAWINSPVPLTNDSLKGYVVVVDFWTYCCINCIHVIPDLKFLEEKYKDQPFVVVGVHSGKFDHEKDAANIRAAVLRNEIHHPVVDDSDFLIWRRFGTRAWPTIAVIGADGIPIGKVSGEGHRELLDQTIAKALEDGRAKGILADKGWTYTPDKGTAPDGPLSFPGKVLVDGVRDRLFIADTGHHRILVAKRDGTVSKIIGSGKPVFKDGDATEAGFNEPQGMTLSEDGNTLFVADRLNHALRSVDLTTWQVTTVTGTGEQGRRRNYKGPPERISLNSPWDVERVGNILYIAMAGSHQIWRYDMTEKILAVHAGTGAERCDDGPLPESTFSQPSGLASDGSELFIADSEDSTIRGVALDPAGVVRSVSGSKDLFGFGFVDGKGIEALFQHPLGVEYVKLPEGPRLFIADTYNHAIRTVDPQTGKTETLSITGLTPSFYEPSGISADEKELYIADTNRHRIVVVPHAGGAARVLKITIPE